MRLSDNEVVLFYELYYGLLEYANSKYELYDLDEPIIVLLSKECLNLQCLVNISNAIWDDTTIIDEFIQDNDDLLDDERKNILLNWKKFVRGKFILERHLKKGSILISVDNNKVYLVKGLYSTWEELVPCKLPVFIEATLLPFEDKIITDGLVNWYRIGFGSGAKLSFKQAYMKAKENNTIITKMANI